MVFLIEAWGFWFPGQELNPGSLHWKCAVPAVGPPGKSLNLKLQAFSKLVQIQKYSPLSQPAGSLSFFRSFLATTRPFFSLPSSPTLFRYIVFGGIQAWQSVKGKPTVKFKSTCAFIKKKKIQSGTVQMCFGKEDLFKNKSSPIFYLSRLKAISPSKQLFSLSWTYLFKIPSFQKKAFVLICQAISLSCTIYGYKHVQNWP